MKFKRFWSRNIETVARRIAEFEADGWKLAVIEYPVAPWSDKYIAMMMKGRFR
jgi:hypothetical protein